MINTQEINVLEQNQKEDLTYIKEMLQEVEHAARGGLDSIVIARKFQSGEFGVLRRDTDGKLDQKKIGYRNFDEGAFNECMNDLHGKETGVLHPGVMEIKLHDFLKESDYKRRTGSPKVVYKVDLPESVNDPDEIDYVFKAEKGEKGWVETWTIVRKQPKKK